jgi:aryl-alcohol dehydrogenase-like predicted oxidoreductase
LPYLAGKYYEMTDRTCRYSPFSLDIESDQIGLLKTARELGVAIVAYSPIGRGMLGGKN